MALRHQIGRLGLQQIRPQCPRPPPASSIRGPQLRTQASRRWYSSSPNNQQGSKTSSRIDRVLSGLPPSLRKYTDRLRDAPVSHVVAFLILHELTAIVPLFGLFGLFHYTNYVPIGYMLEHYGGQVRDGIARFERYFRKKGWFGFGSANEGPAPPRAAEELGAEDKEVLVRWESDGKYKILVEVALAYAVTKILLPVRVVGSILATPWFASVLLRLRYFARAKP